METIESLKRRMQGAQDLKSVVRTMRTLAMVGVRQYERAVGALGDYYRTARLGLHALMLHGWELPHPPRQAGRAACAVLFGSDQGMCGQFNDVLADFAAENLKAEDSPRLLVVGARLAAALETRRFPVEDLLSNPSTLAGATDVIADLLVHIEKWRADSPGLSVAIFHNRPTGGASYEPARTALLPLDLDAINAGGETDRWPTRMIPYFTLDPDALASALVRQYFFITLYRAQVESLAAENAARMAAMQLAEKNIEERIIELARDYNHRRQLTITSELLDIVAGSEALA